MSSSRGCAGGRYRPRGLDRRKMPGRLRCAARIGGEWRQSSEGARERVAAGWTNAAGLMGPKSSSFCRLYRSCPVGSWTARPCRLRGGRRRLPGRRTCRAWRSSGISLDLDRGVGPGAGRHSRQLLRTGGALSVGDPGGVTIHSVLQVEMPVRSLFETPTIAGLAESIEVARGKPDQAFVRPPLPSRRGDLPLSFAQ